MHDLSSNAPVEHTWTPELCPLHYDHNVHPEPTGGNQGLSQCTHIVVKGLGFARMITSISPLRGCAVQIPKYTATTRGGVSNRRNSRLAGQPASQPASTGLQSELQQSGRLGLVSHYDSGLSLTHQGMAGWSLLPAQLNSTQTTEQTH